MSEKSTAYHDTEDEEKEFSLAHHSEKFAIAFSLPTMPSRAPIGVTKNLRLCDDRHLAIKLISRIKERDRGEGCHSVSSLQGRGTLLWGLLVI